jgi:hypothetical protein
MVCRMPVAREEDGQLPLGERADVRIQWRDSRIAVRDGEATAGHEVALRIDDQQGIARLQAEAFVGGARAHAERALIASATR